jgi:hypothetical protein
MAKKKKARVSEETFDDFLAEQGMLATCEERAREEIVAVPSEHDGAKLDQLPSS